MGLTVVGIHDWPPLEMSLAASGRDILRRLSRRCDLLPSEVRAKKGGPCDKERKENNERLK